MNQDQLETLVAKAIDAKEFSYSPYSKFRVGCSLLTEDDQIYTGKSNKNSTKNELINSYSKVAMLRMLRMV